MGLRCHQLGDAFLEQVAHVAVERADTQFQTCTGGDHVVGLARDQRTHGDHGGVLWVHIARDDGLQRHDNGRCRHDGVLCAVRHGAVPTHARERDGHIVARRHGRAFDEHQLPGGNAGHVVRSKNRVTRKALEQTLFDHDLGAPRVFFGGLKNQVQRARKLDLLRDVLGRRHEHGAVPVVTAGVHHACMHAAVLKSIDFLDGQCIHVGPKAQAFAAAAAPQLGHQARGGQPACHGVAPALQLLRQQLRGAELFEAQLRVAVQIVAQCHEGRGPCLQGMQHTHWASRLMDLAMPW